MREPPTPQSVLYVVYNGFPHPFLAGGGLSRYGPDDTSLTISRHLRGGGRVVVADLTPRRVHERVLLADLSAVARGEVAIEHLGQVRVRGDYRTLAEYLNVKPPPGVP